MNGISLITRGLIHGLQIPVMPIVVAQIDMNLSGINPELDISAEDIALTVASVQVIDIDVAEEKDIAIDIVEIRDLEINVEVE